MTLVDAAPQTSRRAGADLTDGGRAISTKGRWRSIRLWAPISPLFLLAAPLPLACALVMTATPRGRALRPVRLAWGVGALLLSLSGTIVNVDAPGIRVRIHIL